MAKKGRPSKFDKLDMAQVERLIKAGLTDKQMAVACEITEQTWYNWKDAHKDFFEVIKDWKTDSNGAVKRSLWERATGYDCKETKVFCSNGEIVTQEVTKHYPPDPTSMIFWLKNREPENWRDRQEVDLTVYDPAERIKRAEDRMKQLGPGKEDGEGKEE